ncbi:MAG: 30S ribosomal protein S16 [Mollicutes bacterium]|nr:30S ribosomal protein S16 [Mollicutes bacterium]
MAVKLRLKRIGGRQKPFYRIVAADSRSPRDGKFIEMIGTYNPVKGKDEINIDEEKALKWLNNGAEVTDTVRNIFSRKGIMEKYANSKTKASKKEVKKD